MKIRKGNGRERVTDVNISDSFSRWNTYRAGEIRDAKKTELGTKIKI